MWIVLLVVASAALHAAWNALLRHRGESRVTTVTVVGGITGVSTLAMLLTPRPWFPQSAGLGWTVASGVLEAGYFLTLALAVERAPVGLTYPISRGGALLIVWPVSVLWLGETLQWAAVVGAGIVLTGLLLNGLRRPHAGETAGIRYAALSALFIGTYNLFYKQALNVGVQPMALFAVSMMVAWPLTLLWLGRAAPRVWTTFRQIPARILLAATLSCGSFWLYLYALQDGGTGEILTLRNMSVVFAQVFALWAGETVGRRQWLGAVVITTGALVLGTARG